MHRTSLVVRPSGLASCYHRDKPRGLVMADSQSVTRTLTLDSRDEAVILFGPRDQFLRTVRDALNVKLVARGDMLQIEGPADAAEQAERAFHQLRQVLRKQGKLTAEDVRTVVE